MMSQSDLENRIEIWIEYLENSGIKLNWTNYALFGGLDHDSYKVQKETVLNGDVLEKVRHYNSLKWRQKLLDDTKNTIHRMSVYCLEDLETNVQSKGSVWDWIKNIKDYLIGTDKSKCKILDSDGRTEIILNRTKTIPKPKDLK